MASVRFPPLSDIDRGGRPIRPAHNIEPSIALPIPLFEHAYTPDGTAAFAHL